MKKIIQTITTLVVVAVIGLGFTSCQQKGNAINGAWAVVTETSSLAMDSSSKYDFSNNGTFQLETYNAPSNNTFLNEGKYELNWISQTLVFNQDGKREEYKIVNLTREKLQLEKVCKKGNPHDIITLQKVAV